MSHVLSKSRWLSSLVAVLCLLIAPVAFGQQTWFIHAEEGNDGNSGLTSSAPLRTLNSFVEKTLVREVEPGSQILLSGTFREALVINMRFAQPAQGLTFRQWTEQDPNVLNLKLTQAVVRGDKVAAGWVRAGTTNRYTCTIPAGLLLASVVWNWDIDVDLHGRHRGHLRRAVSPQAVETTPFSWYYSGTTLHINVTRASAEHTNPNNGQVGYVPYGDNGGLTVSEGVGCVIQGIHAYLWLNDLTGSYGFSQEHSTNGRIIDCVTRDTSHHGVGFTGATGPGNRIIGCTVSGLMGLVGDNSADAFGFLSSGNAITSGSVEYCIAHCYSLLTPEGTALNPQRRIHGFRCGTTNLGQFISGFDVRGLTVYSYYPECGPYSTPVRVDDALPPSNPLDPATYGVRFDGLRVERGGYLNNSSANGHASFVNSWLDFSDCARRGLQGAGAIATGFGLVANNKVLIKNSRILANVDHPKGRFYAGFVFTLQTGLSLYLVDSRVDEVGFRARGSTGVMFGWYSSQGSVYVRGSSFAFRNPFGEKRLCAYDADVSPARRDFDRCRYLGMSAGNSFTDWLGLPGIRTQEGWLAAEPGDPNGVASATGLIGPASATVTPGASENDDDRRR